MTLTTFSTSQEAQQAAALLEGYHFDLGRHDAPQWISLWLEHYRPVWIRDAVIEALYQGRYKAVSVRQILELWQRRSQPIRHATREFEASICRNYGGKLATTDQRQTVSTTQRARTLNQKEPAKQRASRRIHQSLSSISFNLAELAANPSSSGASGQQANNTGYPSSTEHNPSAAGFSTTQPPAENFHATSSDPAQALNPGRPGKRVLIETAETLQAQHQFSEVSYSPSSRAIQPFKPALPFSAQTLRMAKQKALLAAEAR